MTKLFSRARFITQPLINANHLGTMLSTIERAALLVETEGGKIIAANRQAAELTAYTRTELEAMQLLQLMSSGKDLLAIRNPSAQENTQPRFTLMARNQKEISVTVSSQPLGEGVAWTLITMQRTTIRDKKKADEQFTIRLLNRYLPELVAATQETDPTTALQKVLKVGHHLLSDSSIALYLGQGSKPSMGLISSMGNHPGFFPSEIGSPDIHHLIQPALWQKGERGIITILHQKARQIGLEYLASSPISAEEEQLAWLGFIVAGGETPPADHIMPILNILSSFAGSIIHNNLLTANLRKSLYDANFRLNTWKSVSNNIRDGVISVSPQLRITSANYAAEIIFGYAEKEILNAAIDSVLIGSDRLIPALENALRGTATPNLGSPTLHRRDGDSFTVNLAVTPIHNEKAIMGALILVRDLSEHEQIRIRSQQLEQRALLGEVTAIFAHEVRNPINNISMGLQLLDRETKEDDPVKERILHMQEDCQRLTTLMDSVLTFSRTGNYTFNALDVNALLDRILTRWRPRLANANIQYTIQAPVTHADVLGDKRSLEQVFTNIISNAVQAMSEQGSGTLNIKISTDHTPSGKEIVRIDFADNGPGIPLEHQTKIFDPFYTTNPNGTGLGLSISKQIITAHRGNITLTSFPGATIFHIQLPIATSAETANS